MTTENVMAVNSGGDVDPQLQQMLVDSARRWGEGANGAEARALSSRHMHGCRPERWRELAHLGWLALDLPEADGGLGGGLVELCLLAEQLGHSLLVEPFVANVVLGSGLLRTVAPSHLRAKWLPALANGDRRVSWMAWERDGQARLSTPLAHATRKDKAWVVSADKGWMPGAAGVDAVLMTACLTDAPERVGVFMLGAQADGVTLECTRLYDGRHAARLRAIEADAELLCEGPAREIQNLLQGVLDRGLVVHCAETLGSAQAAFTLTREYLRTRRQFGSALADNQVLQHRLVDLYVEQQETRALCLATALSPDPRKVSALALRTADVARHSWQETIQLHGAIGMTEEYAAGEYVRRLAMADKLYGHATDHADRLAKLTMGEIE